MAVPTNTEQTFTQKDIFEDLENLVYNLDPFETPILNSIKRGKATQTYHEWNTDSLPAQDLTNAQIQGDDATALALTATARLGNYTQILTKVVQIAGTTQAVRSAGGSARMGYQLMKQSKALKIDLEGAMTNNKAKTVGASGTAAYMGGFPAYLQQNTVFQTNGATAGADPTGTTTAGPDTFADGSTARTDNTTTTALTETQVNTLALDVYKSSGKPIRNLYMSPANKQEVSKFTGVAGTRFNQVEKNGTFNPVIDRYQTDFGIVDVIPDLFLARSRDVFAINPDFVKLNYLRPFQTEPLAKTGDSEKKMLIVECTVEVCNERALGGIFDTAG